MDQKIIIWAAVVIMLLIVLVANTILDFKKGKKSHLFEMGSEAEMFYVPGDPKPEKNEDE